MRNVRLGFTFEVGNVKQNVYGGPFREAPVVLNNIPVMSVKMAEEITMACDIDVPTRDFSIPAKEDVTAGIMLAIHYMARGNALYIGCMGGRGRTGLFMAILAKVYLNLHSANDDPIIFTRASYNAHAVETEEQEEFVRGFDTSFLEQYALTICN